MPRFIRTASIIAFSVAVIGLSEAKADHSRGVFRAGGGRVLMRQSQHVCSANNLAFWQSALSTGSDLTKFIILNQPTGTENKKSGSDGTFKNESQEEATLDPTLEQAQKDIAKGQASYKEVVTAINTKLEALKNATPKDEAKIKKLEAMLEHAKVLSGELPAQATPTPVGAAPGTPNPGTFAK